MRTSEPTRVLHELTAEALARGEELERLEVRRPTLEEVYLALARRGRRRVRLFLHQLRAQQLRLLAQQGGGALHLPLPAAALRAARLGLQRQDLRRAGAAGAARRAASATAARTPRSPASRSSSSCAASSAILKRLRATPLPAATYIAAMLASTLVVFALQAVALFVLGRVFYGTPFPHAVGSLVARDRPRRRRVRGARRRDGVADPLGGGLVGGRQLHPAADGVPHRLVRADAALPGVPARDRRRAAAEVLRRHHECRLSPRPRDLDETRWRSASSRPGAQPDWSLPR